MLYPNNDEIQQFFANCEKYNITIPWELIWVLMCLEKWITIPEEQWIRSRKEYMSLQENCKNTKKSFDQRNTVLKDIFQNYPDEHYFTFSITPSLSSASEKTDSSICNFQSRDSLIERYMLIFDNSIPAWFLHDLQQSIPEDAMDIVLTLSLSVMPKDEYDSEDFTEFEYIFEHTFDYYDIDQLDELWIFTAYYTCESNKDAYEKFCLMNKEPWDFSEVLMHTDDWFTVDQLDTIIQDINEKDIIQFDNELFRQICLFEDFTQKKEKQILATHIAQNHKRKEFLKNKIKEWSGERLLFLINNRHTNTFTLRNKRNNDTDITFILSEEKNSFLPLLTLMNSLFKTRLSMDDFNNRKKVRCKISWEIIENMITLQIDFTWSKKLNQNLKFPPIVSIEQLYMLMELFCPQENWMNYSLEWLTEA